MTQSPHDEELPTSYPAAGWPTGWHTAPGGPGIEQEMEHQREVAKVERDRRHGQAGDAEPKRPWWRFWRR